jgi:hypothetical protein
MGISVAGRTALVLICLFLFSTCGELETMFPSNGTYHVRTLVNGSSLEECSIIRANDKIRPYFAVSVVNDPDLIGLLVYVQDPRGKIIGDKLQYTLLPYADETALTEEDFLEEAEPVEAEPDEEAEPNENEADESNENEAGGDEYQILERWSFTDTKPVEKNTDIEIAVKSLAAELPYFPLPKEMEIGPYVLVFEAVGKKETLSRTETNVFYLDNAEFSLKDISMYLSGLSGPQLISPGTVVMLETSIDFDSRLDPYLTWYNGKSIISEGKISEGAGKLLWKAPEQAGFYSLRLEALPFRLKRSVYTGLSREIALPVSPKAVSLGYFFENNDEHSARSPLAAGTAYPEHVILLATAAAAAIITADEETPPGGIPYEVPSPVSYPAPELLQWYQFEGSLRSSLSALTNEQLLLPVNESRPRWAAAGQSYGLAIGPDDPYLLSPVNFFRTEKDQGGGVLLFHIRPLSEGIIFSAFFPLQSSLTDGVWINMIKEENVIALRLSAGDVFVDLPVYLTFSATEGFIPVAVEFYIRPYRLEAKISLDEYSQNRAGGIGLPAALSGEGRIRLGSGVDKSTLDKSMLDKSMLENEIAAPPLEEASFEMTDIVSAITDSAPIPVAVKTFSDTVWDELAILFSAVPLLPEEVPVPDVTGQDAAANAVVSIKNTETAENETEISLIPAVQREADADTEPADEEAEYGETVKPEDVDPDDSADPIDFIQEQETQERETLIVFSENP